MGYFAETTPETLGIDVKGIYDFLEGVKRAGIEMHRFMILRHGQCCTKITWEPYTEKSMHPVYSFSKSLTATAIAFARQEGLLALDERLVDLFPQLIPENPSDHLKACTIHDLLCMACGHHEEIHDESETWREAFLNHPFVHTPGTFFEYNTVGTNMLAAVVLKKTGQQVTEYLKPRLFDPLGMDDVFCFALPDKDHTQAGGGGMKLTLENMAKFGQFMLQDGWWEGKCLLKDWYHNMAGTKQIETAGDRVGHVKDWARGYGYQCWMCSLPGSFRADGAFGQFAIVYPTLDMVVVINAATEQTQTMIDEISRCILPAVKEDGLKVAAAASWSDQKDEGKKDTVCGISKAAGRHSLFGTRHLPALLGSRNPVFEQKLIHAVYHKCDKDAPMEGIKRFVGGAGLYTIPDDSSIEQIRFTFDETALYMHLKEDDGWKVLKAAFDGTFAMSLIDGITYAACARWRGICRLELEIRRMDAMSGVRMILTFQNQKLNFEADETLVTDSGLGMTDRRLAQFFEEEDLDAVLTDRTGNNPSVNG